MISKTQQEFLVGAVVGGVVGAVTALAFTPLSGAALRKQVANGIHLFNGCEKRKAGLTKHAQPNHKKNKTAAVKAKAPRKVVKAKTAAAAVHHAAKDHVSA